MTAPPGWWRQRAESDWFGGWLYVMSAQSLAAALPANWKKRSSVRLFALKDRHPLDEKPRWEDWFARKPLAEPSLWKPFWDGVSYGGPNEGVRWHTLAGHGKQPGRLLVLDGDKEIVWPLLDGNDLDGWRPLDNEMADKWLRARSNRHELDVGWPANGFPALDDEDETSNERVALHIPTSQLRRSLRR